MGIRWVYDLIPIYPSTPQIIDYVILREKATVMFCCNSHRVVGRLVGRLFDSRHTQCVYYTYCVASGTIFEYRYSFKFEMK